MYAFWKVEWKAAGKSLLLWSAVVGGIGLICILLYQSMEGSMAGMAENFASMGAFSEAFGMNTLSIATLQGYFATEIGTIHALGSSMFAATLATVILSKEEDGHTAEFTFTLPVAREKIIIAKFAAVIASLVLFTISCAGCYQIGFLALGEKEITGEFLRFMALQLMMNTEIASICFLISAVSKKNRAGIGISIPVILYVYDLMARVVPDLEDVKFISPFSYANATEIFSREQPDRGAFVLGVLVIAALTVISGRIYAKRDLAS